MDDLRDLDPIPGIDLFRLEQLSAVELLRFAVERFGDRAAIGTSFQHSGIVLIDLAKEAGLALRVFTIDTLRLHPETYRHIEEVERHFGLRVERVTPEPDEVARMVEQHGEFLFFDSPEKRLYCCKVRKDKPNAKYMQQLDCWITGVRRDQSEERASTAQVQISSKYGHAILKLNPMANWTNADVQARIQERGLPQNALYAKGYPSIGCAICTTPVRPWEPPRAGRWRWELQGETKECGLHLEPGAGI
ncbi:MAG: phosphoadenylyl-sulfate reductase [Deltaproteobacteria bacterium]|nr:phosphoadenylyl-sulfate reductase [Deltaproteobacteria bacterium]